ncbi:piezo-type mechanosensitive ion channel component 2-like [Genypterus blacodes]|uniref:piezo-type mechanosensitive ion channel component 2-like n=1 Tax=Genypterus blacodes TaxID=154954 RepID=UPI003F758639
MAGDIVVGMLYNLLLPLLLLAASSFRFNGLSLVYFLFLLSLPLVPGPSLVTMKGSGQTGKFLRTIIYTSLMFLSLQCFMQIPFTYIPPHVSGHWDDFFYHVGIVRSSTDLGFVHSYRFKLVDAGNIVRHLAPDVGLFISSLFVRRLCRKLLRRAPQVALQDNCIAPSDPEELETSDTESEGGSDITDGSSNDSSDESTVPVQSGPPQFVQKLIVFAAGMRLLLSTIMNTAGKVVVTILLGLAGITLPSLTSGVYFGVFLGLVWWWVFGRSISLLLFSSLSVMMAIFSAGHLLALYLYQLPMSQQLVPPEDVFARLFGMTGVIRTNSSTPYRIGLHPHVTWPDFISPLVLLLLYYTLVALLQKWVHMPLEGIDDEHADSPVDSPEAPPSFSRIIYISGDKQEPMILLNDNIWQDIHSNELGSLLGGAGYTNCCPLPEYEGKDSLSYGNHHDNEDEEEDAGPQSEEAPQSCEEPPASGPSGVVVFGRLVQKHSYVSALIVMMVYRVSRVSQVSQVCQLFLRYPKVLLVRLMVFMFIITTK